jgi:polysaccharide export outer membrane protein
MKVAKIQLRLVVIAIGAVFLTAAAQERQLDKPAVEVQNLKNYLLGPGDVVEVKIFGQHDLSSVAQVDGDGNLSSLPFLEKPILAKCRNEREIQKDIASAYTRLIVDPQVSVRILERNSRQPAAVFGAVNQPKKIPTVRPVRLNELLADAGGTTDRAAGSVQILHTEPVLCPQPGQEADALPLDGTRLPLQIVKLADLKSGKPEANPTIRPGDYVLVSEAELVYVTGSVVSPGSQLLTDQLTLGRVLARAGGASEGSDLSKVRIFRQKAGALEQQVLKIDYAAIKQGNQPDVLLHPYDVIEVGNPGLSWKVVFEALFLHATKLSSPGLSFPKL